MYVVNWWRMYSIMLVPVVSSYRIRLYDARDKLLK